MKLLKSFFCSQYLQVKLSSKYAMKYIKKEENMAYYNRIMLSMHILAFIEIFFMVTLTVLTIKYSSSWPMISSCLGCMCLTKAIVKHNDKVLGKQLVDLVESEHEYTTS